MIPRVASATIPAMLAVVGVQAQTMVVLETELGDITIEVYEEQAPVSSGSFLDHVDGGYFEGGAFWRTVTRENDNGSPIIEVIQGGVIGEVTDLPTVEHEPTSESGILHEDGIVSLGRSDPGTASGASFLYLYRHSRRSTSAPRAIRTGRDSQPLEESLTAWTPCAPFTVGRRTGPVTIPIPRGKC